MPIEDVAELGNGLGERRGHGTCQLGKDDMDVGRRHTLRWI
jgi:hypothetical protein